MPNTYIGAPSSISIHAPRTGSDDDAAIILSDTPISIHAPRTGSDFTSTGLLSSAWYFNPRSPHGERRGCGIWRGGASGFQSTLPARGATYNWYDGEMSDEISIHAPRTGSDRQREY